jgi:hypothetical protein
VYHEVLSVGFGGCGGVCAGGQGKSQAVVVANRQLQQQLRRMLDSVEQVGGGV